MARRKPNAQSAEAARSENDATKASPSTRAGAKPFERTTTPARVQPQRNTTPRDPHAERGRPSIDGPVIGRTRTARLRLVHVDPWSVMRTTFLLSIVFGIATVVAAFVIWLTLAGTGVWSSINHSVRETIGSTTTVPFDITDYLGLGRVVGFTMLAAVIDAVLFTAIATLGAFLYNLSANLLGGIEATYAEER